jgi:hypothetical protein
MMTIQRDLLRDNPETFWQQAANNPQLKDMSREVWAGCPPDWYAFIGVRDSRSAATDHAAIGISQCSRACNTSLASPRVYILLNKSFCT